MAGNGYFDKTEQKYYPKSVETWDSYDASSTGNDWDSFSTWFGTPSLPLTFTTDINDYGLIATVNYIVSIDSNYPAYVTVKYGDTVDSSGGSIDNPSTINVSPSQTLSAVKARYFQFIISVDRDSASLQTPYIESITTTLSQQLITRQLTSIDSSTLTGIVGLRQLTGLDGISGVLSIVTQPHSSSARYVFSDDSAGEEYVSSTDSTGELYVEETLKIPHILVDKTVDPIQLNIYDVNNSNTVCDTVFDAVVQGLPELSSDANGNITQAQ